MQINEYQVWSRSTAIYPKNMALPYLALGLGSEAGEVAGKIKKQIRDGHIDARELIKEIGDVYWYLARLCDELEVESSEVLEQNKLKLESRKERNVLGGSGDNR